MGRPGATKASTTNHKLGSNPHGYLPPAASVKSSSSGAGMDALCNVAAAAGGELTFHPAKQMVNVEAFSSIHDMIHAAILQYGPPATLRQIYAACQERGRIVYKRAGGSRLITENDNWKAQIRHALYKSGHFKRVEDNQEEWQVTASIANQEPSVTTVAIFADDIGASGSVCGDASHLCAIGDAEVAGNGIQVTSHTRMSTRGGRGGSASGGRGAGGALAPAATPRSTRSKRSRLPSEKYRGANASTRRASEIVSREESKEGMTLDYDKESESYAGQSYGDGEPSSAADTRSGFPGIGPPENGDRRLLRSQLGGKENGHAGCSTEGGAETVGLDARAETPHPMEMCSSFSVPLPPADNKAEATATSGRSADIAVSPDAMRSVDDITPQGYLPMKKRLKAAAAESEQKPSRERQSAAGGSQPKLEVKTDLPAEGPHQDDADNDDDSKGASKRNPNRNRRKPFRGSTPGSNPSSPTGTDNNDDAEQMLDQRARSTRKQRGRPPKPGQTPGITLRTRHPPCTPHVDTPDMEAHTAITNATPTTQPTPATGITTRMSRRMSMQKSPADSADRISTESEGKLDRNCVKAAALVVLQDHKRPLTIKELAGAVMECGLADGGLGRTAPDHAVASTLYLDMEMCSTTPFREEDDGKFGLMEWGSAEMHA